MSWGLSVGLNTLILTRRYFISGHTEFGIILPPSSDLKNLKKIEHCFAKANSAVARPRNTYCMHDLWRVEEPIGHIHSKMIDSMPHWQIPILLTRRFTLEKEGNGATFWSFRIWTKIFERYRRTKTLPTWAIRLLIRGSSWSAASSTFSHTTCRSAIPAPRTPSRDMCSGSNKLKTGLFI